MTCTTWWKPKRRSCEYATRTRTRPSSGSDGTDTSLRETFMNQWCLWWVSLHVLYASCVGLCLHLLSKPVPVFTAERWETKASVSLWSPKERIRVNCGKSSQVCLCLCMRHMSSVHKNVLICTCMGIPSSFSLFSSSLFLLAVHNIQTRPWSSSLVCHLRFIQVEIYSHHIAT